VGTVQRWRRGAIGAYDQLYRLWHRLDAPRAVVPPLLRVETRRAFRTVRVGDGTLVRPGDRVGMIHLDNDAIAALHARRLRPHELGLEFRDGMFASLRTLAALAAGGRFADVRAFAAVTILHRGLRRVGFELEPGALRAPWLTAGYQRFLLAALHPDASARLQRLAGARAERLWISRERLIALHGGAPSQSNVQVWGGRSQ
jgi:hypothetical protein